MMFFPLILIVILIFVYLNPSNNGNGLNFKKASQRGSALEILNKRYASGEISEDEYLRRRSLLEQ